MDPTLHLAARLVIATVLLLAALHKLRDRATFHRALAAYGIVPEAALRVTANVLPLLEIALAGLLLVTQTAAIGAVAAVLLIVAYSTAIAVNLARGRREIDCGCGVSASHLSAALLARNSVLVCITSAILFAPTTRSLVWLDAVAIFGTAACALLLFEAAGLAGNHYVVGARARSAS